jgi:hypothetical protein
VRAEVLEGARLLEARFCVDGAGLLVPGPRQKRGRVQGGSKRGGVRAKRVQG